MEQLRERKQISSQRSFYVGNVNPKDVLASYNDGVLEVKFHAAYDRHFIGITPDYQIIVREDLLYEIDGPMLRHGIQEIHNRQLILPKKQLEKPDRDRLALRFEQFRKAI